MKKIDQKAEKNERNKVYALKFKKDKKKVTEEQQARKKRGGTYGQWCRTEGHPPTCNCAYPSRDEVVAASRR